MLISPSTRRAFSSIASPTAIYKNKASIKFNKLNYLPHHLRSAPTPEHQQHQPQQPQQPQQQQWHNLLYGKHIVSFALTYRPQTCQKLFLLSQESTQEIAHLAKSIANLQVEYVDKVTLNNMCGSRPHQGMLLQASHLPEIELEAPSFLLPIKVIPGVSQLVVVLDEIHDPSNLGSLLRSSFFFGATAILTCVKNSVPITAVAAKASAGCSELLSAERRLFTTKNLMACLDAHKAAGWRILGTAAERESSSLNDIPPAPLTMIVFGNEGAGLRTNIKNRCDGLVHLTPGKRPLLNNNTNITQNVSLNVNSAASAILARWQSTVVEGQGI